MGEGVALSDQFIENFTGHLILNPAIFCNPTRKIPIEPAGEEVGIQNGDLHLTCYSMTRVRFEGEASINNQFGQQRLAVGPPDTLCVPTRKLEWFEIPDLPIGTPADEIHSLPLP